MPYQAVAVLTLGYAFLFKSSLGHCEKVTWFHCFNKRERYVDEIVKNNTDEKIKPKTKPKEIKFDSIAIEKETLDKSIAHLQSIIDADNPRY